MSSEIIKYFGAFGYLLSALSIFGLIIAGWSFGLAEPFEAIWSLYYWLVDLTLGSIGQAFERFLRIFIEDLSLNPNWPHLYIAWLVLANAILAKSDEV